MAIARCGVVAVMSVDVADTWGVTVWNSSQLRHCQGYVTICGQHRWLLVTKGATGWLRALESRGERESVKLHRVSRSGRS
eukprot:6129181-Amphidinium_carterae.2